MTPVPRHALLISDNPATAAPRRIVTALDGTADVRLRPGNYTVESDQPIAFHGKAYQWTQIVDIAAGRDAVLELTADNAEVEPVTAATPTGAAPLEVDPSFLLPAMAGQRRRAVDADHPRVGIRDRREGAHCDEPAGHRHRDVGGGAAHAGRQGDGAASSRRIRRAMSPSSGSIRRSPHRCGPCRSDARVPAKPPVVDGQEIFTIGAPLREPKGMTSGTVSRVEPHAIVSDFMLAPGSAGGPVFAAGGGVVGITSVVDEKDESRRGTPGSSASTRCARSSRPRRRR